MSESNEKHRSFFNDEFRLRLASSLVLSAFVLFITWIGGDTFTLLWAVVAFAIIFEFIRICSRSLPKRVGIVAGAFLLLLVSAYHIDGLRLALGIVGVGFFALAVWEFLLTRTIWGGCGLIYAALPFLAINELRGEHFSGLIVILTLFGCVWGTDIMGFVFGRLIGGPKLAPKISPGKTWTGFVGGLAGGVGMGLFVNLASGFKAGFILIFLLLALAVVSQLGDLLESGFKRFFKTKDSGSLIPGHGGILDRIDGLIAASIALWVALVFSKWLGAISGSLGDVFGRVYLLP